MSNLDVIFKVPLSGGGLILPLSFPQALSREFRVHWRGDWAWSAWTGLRGSPGPMNPFFTRYCLSPYKAITMKLTIFPCCTFHPHISFILQLELCNSNLHLFHLFFHLFPLCFVLWIYESLLFCLWILLFRFHLYLKFYIYISLSINFT